MSVRATLQRHTPMIRLVSLQFASLAAIGVIAPYINLYLVEADFSGTLIGTLSSVGAILALTLTPMLNQFADRRLLHRRLYMFYLLGISAACAIFASTTATVFLVIAVLLTRVTIGPSMTLGMQMTMTQIADHAKAMLGQVRSFAAFGFAAASLLAGQLFGLGGYPLLFWVGSFFALVSIQFATVFPARPKVHERKSVEKPGPRHKAFYVLVASHFFIMMGVQNVFNFMFIHFMENLGVATGDIGMWGALMAGLEIPFFFLMDRILTKIQPRYAYIGGALGMAVFIVLLGMAESLTVVFLLLFLRGICWPVLQLSSFRVVAEVSYIQNVATNQALIQVTTPSIAMLLTGSAFGWTFDHLSTFVFFGLCALMCVIGASIVLIMHRLFEVQPKREALTTA